VRVVVIQLTSGPWWSIPDMLDFPLLGDSCEL